MDYPPCYRSGEETMKARTLGLVLIAVALLVAFVGHSRASPGTQAQPGSTARQSD